jgi:hypothetical protein
VVMAKQPAPPANIDDLAQWLLKRNIAPDTVEFVRRERVAHPNDKHIDHELAYELRHTSDPQLTLKQIAAIFGGVTHQAVGYAITRHAAKLEAASGTDWRSVLPPAWGRIRPVDREDDFDRHLRALVTARLAEEKGVAVPDRVALGQARRFAEGLAGCGDTGAVIFYDPEMGWLLRNRRPDDDPNLIYVPE